MKTDLQKFKDFFDELNIKYTMQYNNYNHTESMYINSNYLYPCYGATLSVNFNEDGEFIEFEAYGE